MIRDILLRYLRPTLGAIAALTAGGCTAQETARSVSVAQPAAEVQEVLAPEVPPPGYEPGPALWKLADEDTTIFLFGTVHLLPEGTQWFDQRISRALEQSDEYVSELDMQNLLAVAPLLESRGTLPAGQSLREMMAPDDLQAYEDAMITLGLPVEIFDRYEPWHAAMMMEVFALVRSGYSRDGGVELNMEPYTVGKTRIGLESAEQQVALFDELPSEVQLEYLAEIAEALPKMTETINRVASQWRTGDTAALASTLNEDTDDELYRRLIVERNTNWANWIENRLDQPGTVFVAVGAGHLAGRGSVQQQLAARGFDVTRIWQ